MNTIGIINKFHWKTDWPNEAQQQISIAVCCNDVFAYSCADAEEMVYDDLKDLWNLYMLHKEFGPIVWCCMKRKELPLREWYIQIQATGIWDLDAMNLNPNPK